MELNILLILWHRFTGPHVAQRHRPQGSSHLGGQSAQCKPPRTPAASANQPTIGPPMVGEPRKATDQKYMTGPRICGELSCCRVLLPSEEKLIEQIPTDTSASLASRTLGSEHTAEFDRPLLEPVHWN